MREGGDIRRIHTASGARRRAWCRVTDDDQEGCRLPPDWRPSCATHPLRNSATGDQLQAPQSRTLGIYAACMAPFPGNARHDGHCSERLSPTMHLSVVQVAAAVGTISLTNGVSGGSVSRSRRPGSGRRLTLLPLTVFVPDRPPAARLGAGRVHRDAALKLDDLTAAPGGRTATVPVLEDRALTRAWGLLHPHRWPRELPRRQLWGF